MGQIFDRTGGDIGFDDQGITKCGTSIGTVLKEVLVDAGVNYCQIFAGHNHTATHIAGDGAVVSEPTKYLGAGYGVLTRVNAPYRCTNPSDIEIICAIE